MEYIYIVISVIIFGLCIITFFIEAEKFKKIYIKDKLEIIYPHNKKMIFKNNYKLKFIHKIFINMRRCIMRVNYKVPNNIKRKMLDELYHYFDNKKELEELQKDIIYEQRNNRWTT